MIRGKYNYLCISRESLIMVVSFVVIKFPFCLLFILWFRSSLFERPFSREKQIAVTEDQTRVSLLSSRLDRSPGSLLGWSPV